MILNKKCWTANNRLKIYTYVHLSLFNTIYEGEKVWKVEKFLRENHMALNHSIFGEFASGKKGSKKFNAYNSPRI